MELGPWDTRARSSGQAGDADQEPKRPESSGSALTLDSPCCLQLLTPLWLAVGLDGSAPGHTAQDVAPDVGGHGSSIPRMFTKVHARDTMGAGMPAIQHQAHGRGTPEAGSRQSLGPHPWPRRGGATDHARVPTPSSASSMSTSPTKAPLTLILTEDAVVLFATQPPRHSVSPHDPRADYRGTAWLPSLHGVPHAQGGNTS